MKIRRILSQTKRIFKWLPIVWGDHDWDHYFLERILIFKLQSMRDFFLSKYAWSEDAPKVAEEILEVITLLEKTEEDYIDEIYPNIDELYDFPKDFSQEYFNRKKTPEEEERTKKLLEIWNKAEILYNRDKRKAFELIGMNYRKWWD